MVCCPASRNAAKTARRAAGSVPRIAVAMLCAAGPESRTMPTPPRPGGVAAATMVSASLMASAATCAVRRSALARRRGRDPPVDVPLLQYAQAGVGDVVQHQAGG